jgi:transcriptional regulator NrdR family protein
MNCQKCGEKTLVKDCVHTNEENYRRRMCGSCGRVFYTIEFEVEQNEEFVRQWNNNYRKNKRSV